MNRFTGKLCVGGLRETWNLHASISRRRLDMKEWKRTVHLYGYPRKRTARPLINSSSFHIDHHARPRTRISQGQSMRRLAGVGEAVAVGGVKDANSSPTEGPLAKYNEKVLAEDLRDDSHQRAIVRHLQDLHDMLSTYHPPEVARPSVKTLGQQHRTSIFGSLFGRANPSVTPPPDLPKGLYMYGDVGSGKTMLMDLFYDTLPPNISSKKRIHFHNFMQDVHRRLHLIKTQHGSQLDALPLVAADIAAGASVLCFDEFQCTDVADAMILRRLLESLMSFGVVMVTTSNRHPDDLYKNGIQRQHFIPCINLLKTNLKVLNLDSTTDYRRIPRPPSGVYHHPLDLAAARHAEKWFEFLGDPVNDPPHPTTHEVWGRTIQVPLVSGRAARFTFHELLGKATSAADYLELVRHYDAFIVTDVPGMTLDKRDVARRFITFIDAVYESKAKLVLTTAVPIQNLFVSESEVNASSLIVNASPDSGDPTASNHSDLSDDMRAMMDELGLSMSALRSSSIFSGDEELFAFARAMSRLVEMGSILWVERGLGVGMTVEAGREDQEAWRKTRSRWGEDNM